MLPTAPAEPWIPVKCPCRRTVLLDRTEGSTGEVRRYCQRCRVWRVVDLRSGAVRVSEPAATCRASA
jgi:hypothetical protein